jgi:DNA-binding transcriptional regulator YiaG
MRPREIVQLRQRLGLTQGKLAERIGVSRETVSRWEKGHYTPEGAAAKALRDLSKRKERKSATASKAK